MRNDDPRKKADPFAFLPKATNISRQYGRDEGEIGTAAFEVVQPKRLSAPKLVSEPPAAVSTKSKERAKKTESTDPVERRKAYKAAWIKKRRAEERAKKGESAIVSERATTPESTKEG